MKVTIFVFLCIGILSVSWARNLDEVSLKREKRQAGLPDPPIAPNPTTPSPTDGYYDGDRGNHSCREDPPCEHEEDDGDLPVYDSQEPCYPPLRCPNRGQKNGHPMQYRRNSRQDNNQPGRRNAPNISFFF